MKFKTNFISRNYPLISNYLTFVKSIILSIMKNVSFCFLIASITLLVSCTSDPQQGGNPKIDKRCDELLKYFHANQYQPVGKLDLENQNSEVHDVLVSIEPDKHDCYKLVEGKDSVVVVLLLRGDCNKGTTPIEKGAEVIQISIPINDNDVTYVFIDEVDSSTSPPTTVRKGKGRIIRDPGFVSPPDPIDTEDRSRD
jgi:hypothetical protein